MYFALALLATSMSFVLEFSNYITITLAKLQVSGFKQSDNWYLVSKLIFRMFGIDMYKFHSLIHEGLDVDRKNAKPYSKAFGQASSVGNSSNTPKNEGIYQYWL